MNVQQKQLDQMHGVRDRQLRRQRLEVLANELGPPKSTYEKYRAEFVGRKVIAHTYNGAMHCEHLAAYYASRPRLKGIRYDAFNKMAREYRKASRDANYAATFWRADNVR